MEKQRIKRLSKSGRRFLIFLLILLYPITIFAQNITQDQINALKILPEEGQKLYTKTDLKFSVTLPAVRSSQVQIISADQQADITFRTIRKSENYDNNGTTIEIWYNFGKKGTYKLRPVSVMIQNRRRTIAFDPVTVTDDPATMLPRMVLVFENGTKIYSDEIPSSSPVLKIHTGRKLHFTVNLQYANQLVQFNWEIPRDSIFTCTKEYEFTEARHHERIYSHNLIPVADFEWIGLIPGIQKLPNFRLNATGYNGYRSELFFPDIYIEFAQETNIDTHSEDTDIFSSAFFQEAASVKEEQKTSLTREDCRILAELYTKEHNEFLLYSKARNDRIDFEQKHGLIISANPIFPTVLLYTALIIIVTSIICIIISSRKKHKIRSLIFTAFLLIGIAISIYCAVRRNERYGICTGCKLYSIPQQNAESVSETASGIKVRILERTDKWYYIEVGESGGWCSTEDIYIIK